MEEKIERVDNMISLLHLEKCKDTIVGDSLIKGIFRWRKKKIICWNGNDYESINYIFR